MTELQGAVGIVQTEKVRAVVARRNELGDLLTAEISGIEGLEAAPTTEGGKHTYWLYPLRVTGWDAEAFARALNAEDPGRGPLHRRPDLPLHGRPVGQADVRHLGYPLRGGPGGRSVEYTRGQCPQTERGLKELVTLFIHEQMTEEDILDMAKAIHKVALGLARK